MVETAFAMGQAGAQGGQGAGGLAAFMPLIILIVIFYFLLIRPQQKRAKQHREMLNNLKKGDRVITSGGMYGNITSIDDTTVTLEVADKVKIKLTKGNVAALAGGEKPAEEDETKGKSKK